MLNFADDLLIFGHTDLLLSFMTAFKHLLVCFGLEANTHKSQNVPIRVIAETHYILLALASSR